METIDYTEDGPPSSNPLIKALNEERFEEAKILLALTPDVASVKDSNGDNLIHIAVRKKNLDVLECILNLGLIDLNESNSCGQIPLVEAALQPEPHILKLLIEKGADMNLTDGIGNTALHYATYYSLSKNCLLLLENGADVNAQNRDDSTALHAACERHTELEIVAMLMCYGADATIVSRDLEWRKGCTPFERSLLDHKDSFVHFLADYIWDGLDKYPFLLIALVAMRSNSPLYLQILDNVTEVIFDDEDLSDMLPTLMYLNTERLRILLHRFGYIFEDLSGVTTGLADGIQKYSRRHFKRFPRNYPQIVENLYIIFKEPLVHFFIDDINRAQDPNVIQALLGLNHRHKLPLGPLQNLLLHLLSYGAELTDGGVDLYYYCFGEDEFFKILLHMDIQRLNEYEKKAPLPAIIYDLDFKLDDYFKKPILYDLEILMRLGEFVANGKIKELCSIDGRLKEKVKNLPDVPSLLEVSRNIIRSLIINNRRIKNCAQFYTAVNSLPISKVYKEIIGFQRRIYRLC